MIISTTPTLEGRPIRDAVRTGGYAEPAHQFGRIGMNPLGVRRSGGEHHPGGLRQQLH